MTNLRNCVRYNILNHFLYVSVNNACKSNPCQNKATCNNGNTYTCSCAQGYGGFDCENGKNSQVTHSK